MVLVATVVRGVNDHELGDLLRLALELGPTVRGLHVQPAAFFGRYPWSLGAAPRCTLPEVMGALAARPRNWSTQPSSTRRAAKTNSAPAAPVYRRIARPPWPPRPAVAGAGRLLLHAHGPLYGPFRAFRSAALRCGRRTQGQTVCGLHWKGATPPQPDAAPQAPQEKPAPAKDAFSRFLAQAGVEQRFTLSSMAFQDALSLDVARVRGCCIHVLRPDGRMIPFCLHNLTAADGARLYKTAP